MKCKFINNSSIPTDVICNKLASARINIEELQSSVIRFVDIVGAFYKKSLPAKLILFTEESDFAFIELNKIRGIRAFIAYNELMAQLAVEHNNCQVVIVPLNIISFEYAIFLIKIFLNARFQEGRHKKRVQLLDELAFPTIPEFNNKEPFKVILSSDHAGTAIKQSLSEFIAKELKYEVVTVGANYDNQPMDYPYSALHLTQELSKHSNAAGIAICGSGIGITIASNKAQGARACLGNSLYNVESARHKNNVNILGLGARLQGLILLESLVKTFLNSSYKTKP